MKTLKFKEKKLNFINRSKFAEQKVICFCVDVYRTYEGDDFDKIYEFLSTLKNIKLKINKTLFEKYKDTIENGDFEQDHFLRTAVGIYKLRHDGNRLLKWLA